jgi:hypothetical protein
VVFKNFLEYWHYARFFSEHQKEIILSGLTALEQSSLLKSCNQGGWNDVLNRNILNETVDEIREDYGFDLIDLRYRILHNKSVYVPTNFWEYVLSKFEDYENEQVEFVLGGIKAISCKENKKVTLLIPFYSNARN